MVRGQRSGDDRVRCQDCAGCQIDWTWDAPDPKRQGTCTLCWRPNKIVKVNMKRKCDYYQPKTQEHTGERTGRKTATKESRV